MELKELRLKNIIKYKKGHIVTVESIDKCVGVKGIGGNYIDGFYDLCHFDPIKLDEEWLSKFGFAESKVKNAFELQVLDDLAKMFFNNDNGYFELIVGKCICVCPAKIKYVHQLQNLYFALTGEDLVW